MAFVREVCTTFGFCDPLGHLQDAGCLAALRDLAHVGVLALPPAGPGAGVDRAVRDLAAAVPPPVGIPDRVDPVEGPVVTLAETDTVCRRLGTMLDAEHPLGAGLHVGRPLRYLVGSDHGWLGGCVVAAPALVLKPRDRWIGREAHLDRVVREAAGLDGELTAEQADLLRFVARMTDAAERRDPADADTGSNAGAAFPPLRKRIRPVEPGRAARLWLARYAALTGPSGEGAAGEAGGQPNTIEQRENDDVANLQKARSTETAHGTERDDGERPLAA